MMKASVVETHQPEPAAPDTTSIEGKQVGLAQLTIESRPVAKNNIVCSGLAMGVAEPGSEPLGRIAGACFTLKFESSIAITKAHAC
jgi:hypothetical protein